jgi:ATPase subunit of ABC transporter with duplicated ATPase domains
LTLKTLGLEALSLDRLLSSLSGGQLTRAWLAKISLSKADFLLLDEPTNHLDASAREMFYSFIASSQKGIVVISHDRTLLNLMDEIVELNGLGLFPYGGNYEFYKAQKAIEQAAKEQNFEVAKKAFNETRIAIQGSKEKHDNRKAQGVALRKEGKVDKLTANSRQGRSERSQSKMLIKHERMLEQAQTAWTEAREALEILEDIKVDLPNTYVPAGKVILDIENLNFAYPDSEKNTLNNISLKIVGAERIAIKGHNGSGKTTLIKLMLGELLPTAGTIFVGVKEVYYCDQNTRLLNPESSIVNNFLRMNPESSTEEAYRSLAQFLFRNVAAEKLVKHLSGGERLRALLACILLSKTPPQLLILDEPTNHLDLSSIEKIEAILNLYRGALIVISHDEVFLENIQCRDNALCL